MASSVTKTGEAVITLINDLKIEYMVELNTPFNAGVLSSIIYNKQFFARYIN